MAKQNGNGEKVKSMESWIWDAACSIRGAADAAKYKDYILPLIFVKRLSDVFDDEIDRIAEKVKTRTKALQLVERDKSLVRFYMPIRPKDPEKETTWDVIRTLSDKIGQQLTDILRSVAKENTSLQGIIDRIDFNATTHGQRDIDDDRLSKLIEKIAEKRLGLKDVEPDIIGRSYEYLIRKFAEGSGQSAGEFYTPAEVGVLMAEIMDAEPGMEIYDPCCGSGGLLIKCELVMEEKMKLKSKTKYAPLKLFGQEFTPATWAMSKMNMVIHDMEGDIEIGDSMKTPKFKSKSGLKIYDRVIANPMWNQGKDSLPYISDDFFINDEYNRFPAGSSGGNADWAWMQLICSALNENGKAAVILDTGAGTRGSGNENNSKEKEIRKYFVDNDLIETIILLPENIFYNTQNASIIIVINKKKKKEGIMMMDLTEFYEKSRPKNFLSKDGLTVALDIIKNWKNVISVATVTSTETIIENDYVLLPSRYVDNEINKNWEVDIQNKFIADREAFKDILIANFFATYFKAKKENLKVESDIELAGKISGWWAKPLSEVLDQSLLTHADIKFDKAPVLSLTKDFGLVLQSTRFGHSVAIEDTTSYKVVKKGWLAYNPMVIWEGAIHVLKNEEIGIVSPAYRVWIPKKGIDYRYLDYILRTPQVMDYYRRLASGGVKRRRIVSETDFVTIMIPVPNSETMKELANQLDDVLKTFDSSMNKLKFETK
jgi:type I restriction enzyme M protein